jgi:hypothetical protein
MVFKGNDVHFPHKPLAAKEASRGEPLFFEKESGEFCPKFVQALPVHYLYRFLQSPLNKCPFFGQGPWFVPDITINPLGEEKNSAGFFPGKPGRQVSGKIRKRKARRP